MRAAFLGLLCFLPGVTHAAVFISEVAWMGSSSSANHEWIELYNDGASVDVSGWTLTDGMNLSISLSGTIPAGVYAVLERSSDESASGAAFLVYTGALVNTGAQLQLKRSDGGLEDQIVGGENWVAIGGDNVTKETAQYTSSGWVTGTPTPGAINKGSKTTPPPSPPPPNTSGTSSNIATSPKPPSPQTKGSSGEAVRLVLPPVTLKLTVDAQKIGYVNQPISFGVEASGIGRNLIGSLVYEWNFGDGTTAVAKNPTHTFAYPGTYAVVVYASYGRQKQLSRHDITILPVDVTVTKNADGDVQISNQSPYEIDISGYSVTAGKTFTFPKFSLLLPQQTITLPKSRVGTKQATIRDAAGVSLSHATPKTTLPIVAAPIVRPLATAAIPKAVAAEKAPESAVKGIATSTLSTPVQDIIIGSSSGSASTQKSETWPYVALIGVIVIGLLGVIRKSFGNQNL
jgi:hypothetical protein